MIQMIGIEQMQNGGSVLSVHELELGLVPPIRNIRGTGNFILLGIFDDASHVERHWQAFVLTQNNETCYSTHLRFCLPSNEMADRY